MMNDLKILTETVIYGRRDRENYPENYFLAIAFTNLMISPGVIDEFRLKKVLKRYVQLKYSNDGRRETLVFVSCKFT